MRDTIEEIIDDIENKRGLNIDEILDEDWKANLEDINHGYRWILIKKMIETYKKQERNLKTLCEIELCTVVHGSNSLERVGKVESPFDDPQCRLSFT